MTDNEVTSTRNSLEMMRRPHLWPNLFLPLVKRKNLYHSPLGANEAILIAGEHDYAVLRHQNMLTPIPRYVKWETGGDDLLQRLIDEGWEVD